VPLVGLGGTSDVVTLGNGTASFGDANVGTGKTVTFTGYSISGTDAANYILSQPASSTASITAGSITITANGQNIIYGQVIPTLSYGCSGGGCGGITGTLTSSAGNAGVSPNAGTYSITKGSLADTGWTILFTGNTLTVAKAPLTVTATSGQQKTYGTVDPALTYNYSGLVNGDGSGVFSGALSRAAGENAGNYAIGQGSLTAGSNYTIDYTSANFTINTAMLTITAKNVSMTYADGTTLNTGSGFTESGLVSGDAITSVSLATNASLSSSGNWNAGAWAIVPSNASGNGLSNYTITYNNASIGLTVAQKALAITGLSGTDKVYDAGTNDPVTGIGTLSGVVAGLNNGGGTSDVVTLGNGTAAFADANVGTGKAVTLTGYSISGADAGNYTLSQPAASTANITAATVLPPSVINPPTPPANNNSGNGNSGNSGDNGSSGNSGNTGSSNSGSSISGNGSGNSGTNSNSGNSANNGSKTGSIGINAINSINGINGITSINSNRHFGSNYVNNMNGGSNRSTDLRSGDLQRPQVAMDDSRNFNVLNRQMDAMEEPVSEQTQMVRHVVVPGVVAISVLSMGYMLLFSRAMYVTLAATGLTTLRQKLDPVALLEYWEHEGKGRSVTHERDKYLETMFD
jgi:MBG domain (YGX type)/YDG domain